MILVSTAACICFHWQCTCTHINILVFYEEKQTIVMTMTCHQNHAVVAHANAVNVFCGSMLMKSEVSNVLLKKKKSSINNDILMTYLISLTFIVKSIYCNMYSGEAQSILLNPWRSTPESHISNWGTLYMMSTCPDNLTTSIAAVSFGIRYSI